MLCPERLLFDVRNQTWLVETISISGHLRRANRPNTRLAMTALRDFSAIANLLNIGSVTIQ